MSIVNDPNFDSTAHALEVDRGIPLGSLKALVGAESGGNANAVSPVGARGLTQFMPATAKQYNVDVTNPWDSLRGTADMLGDLNAKYNGNFNAALSSYNGGAHNAQYFVDGTVPSTSQVSPTNHAVNKNYVAGITANIAKNGPDDNTAFGAVQNQVASMRQQGASDTTIYNFLGKSPVADAVSAASSNGMGVSDIISKIGGQPLAIVTDAQNKVNSQGALTTAAQGAKYGIQDMSQGAQQIGARLGGNDSRLSDLQAQQAAAEQDPTRQAVMTSTAGTVGSVGVKAIPSIAAAVIAPESIPFQLAAGGAAGAAEGALTPTTGDGQILSNIGYGAAGGAVGGAGGTAIASAPRFLVKSGQAAMRGGEDVATVAGRQATLASQGIDASAAQLGKGAAGLSNTIERNVPFSGALGADMRGAADTQVARAITKQIGNESDVINSTTIKGAQDNISKLYSDALDGVHLPLTQGFTNDLDAVVNKYTQGTLPSLRSNLPSGVVDDLKALAQQGSAPAKQLQDVRSSIGKTMSSTATSPVDKQALGGIYDAINNVIEKQLPPDNLAKFQMANTQYRALQPVEKMVVSSGDSGSVSARQMLNAIKSGKYADSFQTGNAPFQDLVTALQAGDTKGFSNPISGEVLPLSVATGHLAGLAAIPAGNIAQRLLTNPKYANMLLGLNPVQRNALIESAKNVGTGVGAAAGQQITAPSFNDIRNTPSPQDYAKAIQAKYRA
ncbi:lytic transglycosylase domain-containing protein [Variovorax sp. LG9.2]|uniref:lytic transglycosylase domain-containing protein n=1 Tax=Variovorax sp. LG9.2 TaxID=3048626 RepID=UPI002B23DD1F|nr:lytic transglycosylase domain-containing protein [Variovorax sp. LG9.2]MEB0057320.1 lytic transglycosylase domain-containing protein [Variovorax sp. LG9.2]